MADGAPAAWRGDPGQLAGFTGFDAVRDEKRWNPAELREAGDLKCDLVAMTSHELRDPLTSILGFTESLRERRGALTQEQQDPLPRGIDRQARLLFRLVHDLMVGWGSRSCAGWPR